MFYLKGLIISWQSLTLASLAGRPFLPASSELNISNKMTPYITQEYKTNKQFIQNYLIGVRANLEAALMTDKRPKLRSDIEDAMIVVNNDVRRPRRHTNYKWIMEAAVTDLSTGGRKSNCFTGIRESSAHL